MTDASPSTTPSPKPIVTPTPAPTPEPVAIEYTKLKLGKSRTLPANVELFYQVGPCGACNACGMGFGDIRRVVFDATAGAYREDRPAPETGHLESFEVSAGGREMAAMVCDAGYCDGLYDLPSVDAEQHLWVSRDGASTWEDLGPVLPAARIIAMTSSAVLIAEWNYWHERSWYDVTDEEWEELLARLGPLGLDDLEDVPASGPPRLRWAIIGPEAPAPEVDWAPLSYRQWMQLRPNWAGSPGFWGFAWWSYGSPPDGGRVWTGFGSDRKLLATADEQGTLRDVYDVTGLYAESANGIPFVVSDTLLVYDRVTCVGGYGQNSEVRLVDLATGSIHPVEGLSLPMVENEQGESRSFLYNLWRVVPLATE